MRARLESRHLWPLILVTVAIALVILVCTDVRRRGRLLPAPADAGVPSAPVGEPTRDSAGRFYPFGISPNGHRTDLTAYTAAARVLHDGGSAEEAYSARSPRGWRYQYPPLLASLLQPISTLSTTTQALLFGLVSALLALLLLDESRRWWRLLSAPGDAPSVPLPAYIAIGAIAAVVLPSLNALQRGQVGLLVAWPLMAGFRWMWTARRPSLSIAGGALLTFPAVMKLLPTLSVGFSLLMAIASAAGHDSPTRGGRPLPGDDAAAARGAAHRRRAALSALGISIGVALFAFAIPAVLIGPTRTLDATRIFWRQVMTNPSFSTDWEFEIHANRNQSLDSAAWKLVRTLDGGERVAADPLGREEGVQSDAARPRAFDLGSTAVRGALGLGALVVSLRLARRGIRGAFAGFGLAALTTLVVSPVSWGHHFTMLLPAMLAIPAWLESRGRSPAAFTFSAALGVAVVLHYASIDALGSVGLLGIVCGLALALLLPALWGSAAPRRVGSAARPSP